MPPGPVPWDARTGASVARGVVAREQEVEEARLRPRAAKRLFPQRPWMLLVGVLCGRTDPTEQCMPGGMVGEARLAQILWGPALQYQPTWTWKQRCGRWAPPRLLGSAPAQGLGVAVCSLELGAGSTQVSPRRSPGRPQPPAARARALPLSRSGTPRTLYSPRGCSGSGQAASQGLPRHWATGA